MWWKERSDRNEPRGDHMFIILVVPMPPSGLEERLTASKQTMMKKEGAKGSESFPRWRVLLWP